MRGHMSLLRRKGQLAAITAVLLAALCMPALAGDLSRRAEKSCSGAIPDTGDRGLEGSYGMAAGASLAGLAALGLSRKNGK